MKFVMTFKTPDAAHYAIADVRADGNEHDVEAAENLIDQFVKYGEYVSIEFDTSNGTATVVKA